MRLLCRGNDGKSTAIKEECGVGTCQTHAHPNPPDAACFPVLHRLVYEEDAWGDCEGNVLPWKVLNQRCGKKNHARPAKSPESSSCKFKPSTGLTESDSSSDEDSDITWHPLEYSSPSSCEYFDTQDSATKVNTISAGRGRVEPRVNFNSNPPKIRHLIVLQSP
jgi:hypothetical protein